MNPSRNAFEPTAMIKAIFIFFEFLLSLINFFLSLFVFFRYIKAALLPMQPPINHMCWTKPVVDLRKPTFGETFPMAVPLNKLYTKTLQVNVWCTGNEYEECLVRVYTHFFLQNQKEKSLFLEPTLFNFRFEKAIKCNKN